MLIGVFSADPLNTTRTGDPSPKSTVTVMFVPLTTKVKLNVSSLSISDDGVSLHANDASLRIVTIEDANAELMLLLALTEIG